MHENLIFHGGWRVLLSHAIVPTQEVGIQTLPRLRIGSGNVNYIALIDGHRGCRADE